jgi:hypothetical protein
MLHYIDIAICVAAGIFSVMWFEGLKFLKIARNRNRIY